jgi:hypothetical protein
MGLGVVWGFGGYIPPMDLHTSGWGVRQFFPRSNNKLFGETSDFSFLLAAGEIFGSWGGYTPPPPQRKKTCHVCLNQKHNMALELFFTSWGLFYKGLRNTDLRNETVSPLVRGS